MTVHSPLWWLALLISPCLAQAQSGVDAIVHPVRFHVPGQGEQVDVNIAVLGGTAQWVPNAHGFQQAHVEALTLVERDGTIVDYRKTMIDGPERTDTLRTDFVHQEHFVLQPGEYVLSVELTDPTSGDTSVARYRAPLILPVPPEGIALSDIALTAAPIAGHNASAPLPYVGHYFPQEVSDLGFYMEAYNTPSVFGMDSLLAINYQIETYETHEVKGVYRVVKRVRSAPVVQLAGNFQIADLPSGNYVLAAEVMGRDGKVLARREHFLQRNNPLSYDQMAAANKDLGLTFASAYTDADTLAEHLRSLRPIAGELERKIIDDRWKDRDVVTMQRFLYTFWYNRNAYDPKSEWERYRQAVIAANRLYGCRNMRGYDSDMGYVYLKFGPPNTVTDRSNETSSLPYQIWHYYRVGKYTDKRFVFWQPELATICWQLLHSEVPGEMKNPNWMEMLHRGSFPADPTHQQVKGSVSGREVQDNWDNPR
ncbi:MAG TPA: GWxTD domain-containing protein [Flavobacteriales bacterium]|jgi:GWxTD domain-containing protein|nr:GWxTD domain-containing protein [Flavobacteriales bacterium]